MIPRYTLPEMALIWSDEHRLAVWQNIEALAAEAWEKEGMAPPGTSVLIRSAPPVTARELEEREQITRHDLAAFVDLLSERSGAATPRVHYGLTSSDVLDTATAVLLAESADLLSARLGDLFVVVRRRAFEHRDTMTVGRTHGMWAEPTTFGLKLASWAFELARDHERLRRVRDVVAVGKVSGAVGTYSHVWPSVEAHVCAHLGLGVEGASTQVTARDRHADYLQVLALCGASIERFATEIRHLARSDVAEVAEPFGAGQKGSSAMPHKRNPVISERMAGLARLLRAYAQVGVENVALWHERDISHSSAERVVLPDASLCLHYMLVTFAEVMAGLVVDTTRMRHNLDSTRGVVYSQAVLHALIDAGLDRAEAYEMVQRAAAQAQQRSLREILAGDPDLPLTAASLEECFSPERLLSHTGAVFERLEAVRLGS